MWIVGVVMAVVAVPLLWEWGKRVVDTRELEERYENDD
jgi:hypothetical protein